MTDSKNLQSQAELSMASYANLTYGSLGSSAQQTQLRNAGFSNAQAEKFSTTYTVVSPTYHDATSDLDVMVFKDASDNLTIGFRGTQETHDSTWRLAA